MVSMVAMLEQVVALLVAACLEEQRQALHEVEELPLVVAELPQVPLSVLAWLMISLASHASFAPAWTSSVGA
jgi:hypothetical protein